MAPWTLALKVALLTVLCSAQAERLSLPSGWSFSTDLSFPSHSSSSSLNSYCDLAPFSLFVPIVSSTSFNAGFKGFSVGFLSLFESSASSPSRIYFCVCLGVSKSGPSSRPFLVPVWTLNVTSTSPLQQQSQSGFVKLEVNDNAQLLLEDGDGSIVWSMNNTGSMEMLDNGNLIFYDRTNQTLWQSFNFPSDTLLQGQQFSIGMELSSSNHMYNAAMQPGGFLFSLVSTSPLPLVYWILTANTTVSNYFGSMVNAFSLNASAPINLTSSMTSHSCAQSNYPYALLSGDSLVMHGACGALHSWDYGPSDLVRLDADGNMRDYSLHQLANSSYAITSSREEYRPCYVPNVCGAYGICTINRSFENSVQHYCRCPSEEDNDSLHGAFMFIDAAIPSQGCERVETLLCNPNSTQALVEIKGVASIAMLYLFELTWKENSIHLEDCKVACASNCSCTGFLYHTKSSFCLQIGDKTGISNLSLITLSSNDHVAYVKMQSKIQPKSSPSDIKKHRPIMVVAVVLIPLIFTAAVGAIMCKKCKQKRDPELELAEQQLLGVMPTLPTRFSYQELSKFTKGFSTCLGSGAFGSVYAGVHPDGKRVAVKKLELLSHGQKEFLAEIATIGGIRHVNIVHLYGFCLEKQHRLLVYEHVENGSLDRWLFGKVKERPVMSWETRFNVALGTARGLAFLHEECPKPILHFDVKPQNILLDEDFKAKLADFGLSKLVANGESAVMTVLRGTPGYIAPEWVSHSVVSKKCDVYSFGMVLLELVSGRKNAEFQLSNECHFPKWAAKKNREGKVDELLDKRLVTILKTDEQGVITEKTLLEEVKRVVGVALLCISVKPEMRPTMTTVCSMLEGTKDVSELDIEVPAFSVSSSSIQVISDYSSIEAR